MARFLSDILTIVLTLIPAYLVFISGFYDEIVFFTVFAGYGAIVLINAITFGFNVSGGSRSDTIYKLDVLAMILSFVPVIGLLLGEVLAADPVIPAFDWNAVIFGYYFVLSFMSLLVIADTMRKVPKSVGMVIGFPIIIVVFGAKLLLTIWDLLFTPRIRELVPYLDVTRDLILNISIALADPKRIEAETALSNLGDLSGQVDDLAEGYALRKGVGQSIDVGLTVVVFAFLGVLTFMTDLGIPPQVIALLFGSLALALSTFAGFFGPFYGLAGACKEFTLRHGNYRAAAIYRVIENVFSIPFNVASAGFLFLDLPPIDAETLEDFKGDLQKQLEEVTENISSLLGRDRGAVPKKTQKMIAELAGSAESNLNKLDFRDLREETAREFALTYFSHEFSWKPWARKTAVKEFADKYYFDQRTGEENLMLISDKIRLGQADEDLVNNVMVSAALRGIVMMEQKYQETLADLELGQTCTGLAFGARQFLKDHYKVQTPVQKWWKRIYDFFMGIFAIPIVSAIAFNNYANRLFDASVELVTNELILGGARDYMIMRSKEIVNQIMLLPSKLKKSREEPQEIKEEKIKQRNWEIKRKLRRLVGMVWEVLVFPFTVIFGIARWIANKFKPDEEKNPREGFEEAVAHTALVAIYDELFKRLVMQTHVSTGY